MAMIEVENAVALIYKGITIYHIHRNDYQNDSVREYWFSFDPHGSDCGESEDVFDIRELPGYSSDMNGVKNLIKMIDTGVLPAEKSVPSEDPGFEGFCPTCGGFRHLDQFEVPILTPERKVTIKYSCEQCGITSTEYFALGEGIIEPLV